MAIKAIDKHCTDKLGGKRFSELSADQQYDLLKKLEKGSVKLEGVDAKAFFDQFLQNTIEGYFSDPIYGGNRDMAPWKMIGFPGARYDYRPYVDKHAGATGLMAEVVTNSTSNMTMEDLHAMAVYIKSSSGKEQEPAGEPDQAFVNAGAAIFSDSRSGCHRSEGQGVPGMFPPLAHNANAQQKDPTTIIRAILEGAQTVPTDRRPTPFAMPAFEWKLDDDQVAAVATYVRNAWGNSAPAVTADDVKSMREELQASSN